MLKTAWLKSPDVSEENVAPIFREEVLAKKETSVKQGARRATSI
jgi:hypothetical protein